MLSLKLSLSFPQIINSTSSPFLATTPLPFPFDDGCPPSLLMSTPPLIITPPWSTNSVPCHPISRHTVLSGREGEGRTMQNVIAKLFPPVDTNNTYTQTRAPANTVIFLFSMPSILINCIHQHASSSYVIRELKVQHDCSALGVSQKKSLLLEIHIAQS